jgi:Fe-S cluster biosynthesis and repair protein YggX
MAQTVFCKKHQKQLEGLDRAPFPGQKGIDVLENISKQAWQEWQALQTMLINEKQLNMMQADSRKYIMEQMEKCFNNEETDKIQGHTDFDDIEEL